MYIQILVLLRVAVLLVAFHHKVYLDKTEGVSIFNFDFQFLPYGQRRGLRKKTYEQLLSSFFHVFMGKFKKDVASELKVS